MRKFLASIATLAILLVGMTSAALAATGNPSAAVHISPVHYQDWKAQGYVFPAGFELYTFNYAKMSEDCRAEVAKKSVADQSKIQTCGEYTVSELLKEFRKAWTNRSGYFYRIEK